MKCRDHIDNVQELGKTTSLVHIHERIKQGCPIKYFYVQQKKAVKCDSGMISWSERRFYSYSYNDIQLIKELD